MSLWKPMLLLAVVLGLATEQDLSLRVDRTVSPVHPVNTAATGLVVAEVEWDRTTETLITRGLYRDTPFAPPALNALTQWRFTPPPGAAVARTSVTFLFRAPAMYAATPLTPRVSPWSAQGDTAALPREVIDPGYPAASIATGAVIVALHIDTAGAVTGVEAMHGVRALTEISEPALKAWKFSPALLSGKSVPSTVYAVISFLLPT